ncbi:hypothetical protein H0H93_000962, partial [Arthromyces matolae]
SNCSSAIKNRTATEYIGVLDEIEFTRRARGERIGGTLAQSVDPNRTKVVTEDEGIRGDKSGQREFEGIDGDRNGDGDGDFGDRDIEETDADHFLKSITRPSKRNASNTDVELIEYEPVARKRKIDPSKLPWAKSEQEAREIDDPYFQKTFQTLEYMGRDLAEVERFLAIAKTAPSGFPTTQWKRILAGQSVDLDIVHSARHHIGSIRPDKGVSGTSESSSRPTDNSRSISTQGEWSTAFKLYKRA